MSHTFVPSALAVALFLGGTVLAPTPAVSDPPPTTTRAVAVPDDVASIDAIIAATYDVISGDAGAERDWDRFRSLFVPGHGRLSSVGPDKSLAIALSVRSPEEYIESAGKYFERSPFFEREVARRVERFGHIAHVFSTYESAATAKGEAFARGINSFQLVWNGERWSILSILWDAERDGQEIPKEYLSNER